MKQSDRSETVRRYAFAVALVTAAALLRWLMGYLFGSAGPFVTFYPAVIITILAVGYGPALLALVLSGLTAAFFFMAPVASLRVEAPGDIATLAMFCLSGVLLIVIALRLKTVTAVKALRESEQALRRAHDELELRIQERTEELRTAYEKLMHETKQREQAEAQLRQAQKMEALGTLSGGIAHDFNNILAAIIGFTELVAEHTPKGSRDEHHLGRVMEASLRGRDLVRQMLTFSRSTSEEKKPLLLSSVVSETVTMLRATTPTTIRINVNIQSESGLIFADPTQIQQILLNLCTNATHAMRDKGGILDVELSDFSVPPSGGNGMTPGLYMKLVIRDTGAGIPPEIMEKIFDPFFTTKKIGEGTGLGLSVVHGIVKRSGGYITVESEPEKGTTFTVYFPKVAGEKEAIARAQDAIPTGSEHILFVDDEEAIVEMGEEILAELGYEVTSRTSSTEAFALLKENPSRFDLVITDQTMPDMTGVELAKEILTLRPGIPVILCTGFSHLVDAEGATAAGIRAFAMKPLTKREIAKTIRKVLDETAM